MATSVTNGSASQLLVVSGTGGITVIDPSTPLKRLNYFDGKFLRADDFDVEQHYLRRLVALSNQGLGAGIVYGYDTSLGRGDTIQIGPGLAVDPSGHVLLLQTTVTQDIPALIEASRVPAATQPDASGKTGPGAFTDCVEIVAPPATTVVSPVSDIYVIAICAADALCGQADVFGKLCEEACVTSTDRPYRLDGVVLRAIPLQLVTPFPASKAVDIQSPSYLRSKVAHSWFSDETRKHPDAVSRAGLLSTIWCLGAGYSSSCCEVPLAVVARAGAATLFLDAWIVRRERIEAPARRYWQWTMRMRPWEVFLAQVLQFHCQLADLLSGIVTPGSRGGNPCAPQVDAINQAAGFIEQVRAGIESQRKLPVDTTPPQPALLSMSLSQISDLQQMLRSVLASAATPSQPTDRILLRGGILELSPAGYLPVLTGTDVTVNDQVRALLGDGLDLRFCITTADYIAHAMEEAQHLDRISLVQGLDDPSNKPRVDILVPDGNATVGPRPSAAVFDADLRFSTKETRALTYRGAAREETLASGGTALYVAATGLSQGVIKQFSAMAQAAAKNDAPSQALSPDFATNAFVSALPTDFDSRIRKAGAAARAFTIATGVSNVSVAAAATAPVTVDGLWLTARSERDIRSLGVGQQTSVSLRIVLGRIVSASPEAFELTFNGTLSVNAASATLLTGKLSGIYSFGVLTEVQTPPKTTEFLLTQRGNWEVTLNYGDGSITLEVPVTGVSGSPIVFTRTLNALGIVYQIAAKGGAMGSLTMKPDSGVVDPANAYHQYAETGLDIVHSALIVGEPTIRTGADAQLFPPATSGTTELTIQAVRDWVMFTKRREKRCAADVAPAAVLPPRRYRILNVPTDQGSVAAQVQEYTRLIADPTKFAGRITALISKDTHPLVVTFGGGTATMSTAPSAIAADWKAFFGQDPTTIVFAAAGADGESGTELQLTRIKAFENAIAAFSTEGQAAAEVSIFPYLPAAVPPDADGVMLFITSRIEIALPQRVYLSNQDVFRKITAAVQDPSSGAPLADLLDSDGAFYLGATSYSVTLAGVVTVDAATVDAVHAKIDGMVPRPAAQMAMVITPKGTSASDIARAVAAAVPTVTAVTPGVQTTTATYAGQWPSGATPSILVIERAPVFL